MQTRYIMKCTGCGAPLADSLRCCPYCGVKTSFESLGMRDGLRKEGDGRLVIENGAKVVVGASKDEVRPCPFCGASTPARDKSCGFCGAKIVLETLWLRSLTIQKGGSMEVFSGGKVQIGRPPADAALLAAAESGDVSAVRARLDAGDELDGADDHGVNALLAAIRGGKEQAAVYLVAMGANLTDSDEHKHGPLHYAAWNGLLVVIDALLAAGADPSAESSAGKRPIDLCRARGLTAAVERLAPVSKT